MKPVAFLIFVILFPVQLLSQPGLTLLCVAAHPDDEDGATLVYYSKIKGYNAYTVFYTRGEGGQNEIGPELNDELGKLREKECCEAADVQGSKAYFLGLVDFGFSKTAKETFRIWGGKDSVLARIVCMIRTIRPDVIISNHDTVTLKPYRQHGNHQAVGISIFEAFEKAADPAYHPEQLQNGITAWQVKKLFFRVYDTAGTADVVSINVLQKSPDGRTLEEISFEALSKHRTQGMDKLSFKDLSSASRFYELLRSDRRYPHDKNDLFSGIPVRDDTSPARLPVSYTTQYNYRRADPEDSAGTVRLLKVYENAKIGLVRTYDNTIESIFNALGVRYDTLSSADVEHKDLSSYSTIILDLRAYLFREDVRKNNFRLLQYVENGGNIICFYNKPQDWNGKGYSPYPIFLTSERVTEEDSRVDILRPDNRFFRVPNSIGGEDWEGWVQERNIYLPSDDTSKTSPKYLRLLAASDEDDPVPPTSLLWTEFGRGTYTYCSLAVYRQLKLFNRGALKLFFNMLSQKNNSN